MDRVFVNITWKCQNLCPYCWHRLTEKGLKVADGYLTVEPDKTEDEWISALNKLEPACFDFVGGEPFLKDMTQICNNLDRKHCYAITSNLKSDTVKNYIDNVNPDNCVVITGSYHPHSDFSEKDLLDRLLLLRRAGFPVGVNIVDHPSVKSKEKIKAFFNEHSIKVNISPYEECRDLYVKRKKQILFCDGGLCNYAINNNGDVYRCLTWFRFLAGCPKEGIKNQRKYSSLFRQGCLGNVFEGSFKKHKKRKRCTIFCEWKNVVDPTNTMVEDLNIRTLKEEWLEALKSIRKKVLKILKKTRKP